MSGDNDPRIERIRSFRRVRGLSPRGLAIAGHVPIGEVLDIDSPDWDPLPETLTALDRLVPTPTSTEPAAVVTGPRLHNRARDTINRSSDRNGARSRPNRGDG